jgi:hypothetical protein
MGFTLEDRIGLTMGNINMLAEIATTTGVCITEYKTPKDFCAAYLETISFDLLYEVYQGKAGKIGEKMRAQVRAEMDRRISNSMESKKA